MLLYGNAVCIGDEFCCTLLQFLTMVCFIVRYGKVYFWCVLLKGAVMLNGGVFYCSVLRCEIVVYFNVRYCNV